MAEDLRSHSLPPGVLPLAPRRPFGGYSAEALAEAATLVAAWPEKCGILSHVVRDIGGLPAPAAITDSAVIEAHFDATAIPPELGDVLLRLGFEPDGFASFVPAHFATHHTLKFKVDARDTARRRTLRAETERRCAALIDELETRWSGIEAYLELEIYTATSRRRWHDAAPAPGWAGALPFATGALAQAEPPCSAGEVRRDGLSLDAVKHADLHLKIARATPAPVREAMIAALEAIGLYRVLTWAGNHVCTAQFAAATDAKRCFDAFAGYFDRFGGCAELTMEPVAMVWRSRTPVDGEVRLGALPPLVTSVADVEEREGIPKAATVQ